MLLEYGAVLPGGTVAVIVMITLLPNGNVVIVPVTSPLALLTVPHTAPFCSLPQVAFVPVKTGGLLLKLSSNVTPSASCWKFVSALLLVIVTVAVRVSPLSCRFLVQEGSAAVLMNTLLIGVVLAWHLELVPAVTLSTELQT